jgi:hypothetical protein
MGRAKAGSGSVPDTEAELVAAYGRAIENVSRAAMLSHAEELGRAAGCSELPEWDGPVVDPVVFGSQMRSLDARADSVPRLDVALSEGKRQRLESGRLRQAIEGAERTELRQEKLMTEARG